MFGRTAVQRWASLARKSAVPITRAHCVNDAAWISQAAPYRFTSWRGIKTDVHIEGQEFGFVISDIDPDEHNSRHPSVGGTFFKKNTKYMPLSTIWMRDNCQCSKCINPDTLQRNFDTFKIDFRTRPVSSRSDERGLRITWEDGHESYYVWPWVEGIVKRGSDKISDAWNERKTFNSQIAHIEDQLSIPFDQVMRKKNNSYGMAKLMDTIKTYGFAFVSNTPISPTATEELLESIGPIRNTHYGGFYDFIPDLASKDTAYTNQALAPHTDTTYFTEPAGLQAFHMLSHEPPPGVEVGEEGLGGRSILVDGFRVAEEMRKQYPKKYRILARTGVPWHASGNLDHSITPEKRHPVVEIGRGDDVRPPKRIRWNNDDRGTIPPKDALEWYRAAKIWDSYLKDPEYQYWFQLKPGSVLIFDNWRVLHGRDSFEGRRRICGAYINRDDYYSKWKLSSPFSDTKIIAHNLVQYTPRGDKPYRPRDASGKPLQKRHRRPSVLRRPASADGERLGGPPEDLELHEAGESKKSNGTGEPQASSEAEETQVSNETGETQASDSKS